MGHNRQELPGRSGAVIGLRCTCCGGPLSGAWMVTAVLRGISYEYCDDGCRDRHAAGVDHQSELCELCDLDAAGDTGRCDWHLHDDGASGAVSYPLAS